MSAITAKAADMNPLMLPTVCVGSVASICNHNVPSIGAHPTTRSHHIIILIRHQYNHNSLQMLLCPTINHFISCITVIA
eukprot:m.42545 g.42545  ORF g.42545 m.42545 type:complete len:79 (+) comp7063_c0_seq4:1999-2235(+)